MNVRYERSEALSLIRRHEGCTSCIKNHIVARVLGRSHTNVVSGTSTDEIS